MHMDGRLNMHIDGNWHWMTALSGLAVGYADAAPIEGRIGSNAAVLLFLLGVWALLMGMRNLRWLRHKRLVTGRQRRESEAGHAQEGDAPDNG